MFQHKVLVFLIQAKFFARVDSGGDLRPLHKVCVLLYTPVRISLLLISDQMD